MGLDALVETAKLNGGRATQSISLFSSEIQRPALTATASVNNQQPKNASMSFSNASPSISLEDYRDEVGTGDQLWELEQANRLVKAAKENKKNAEDKERRRRIARMQKFLACAKIIPFDQQELEVPFSYYLPAGIKDVACHLSEITGLAPRGIAFDVCGAISIATWGRVTIELSEAWSEPTVDMIIQIAPSGKRKSSLAKHLRDPFIGFCSQANAGYEERTKNNKEKSRLSRKAAEARSRRKIEAVLDRANYASQSEELATLKEAIDEAAHFNLDLMPRPGTDARVQVVVDKGTTFKLSSILSEHGECQGCITAEGNMLSSKMVGSLEAADLFLRGHTQEPYVYENAKMRINLAHPALPMVNLVQPVVARKFYGNQTLNENGVTARFVPYFHLDAAPATQRFNLEVSLEAYNAKITQLLQMFYTQDRAAQRYRVGVIPAALRLVHRFEDVVRSDVIPYMPEAAEPYLRKAHGQAVRFAWDIHAWNNEQPHLCPITEEEMQQGIDLVRATFPHVRYAFDPCGFVVQGVAQEILESLYRITDRYEQERIITEGIDSTTIQQRIHVNAKETNNALRFLDRHNYLAVYDDATNNLKVALRPDFFAYAQA